MTGMSIQERYDDISELSGLSEEIIRRVYKATKQSIAKSIKKGERATVPGLFTVTPEIKNKINIGGESMTSYVKLKATVSSALETEFEKLTNFESTSDIEDKQNQESNGLKRLNLIEPELRTSRSYAQNGIRTSQISALL